MARSEIPMVINLRQNKNDESTAYGKYFEPRQDRRLPDVRAGARSGGGLHEGAADAGSAREARRIRYVQSECRRCEAGQGEPRRGCGRRP